MYKREIMRFVFFSPITVVARKASWGTLTKLMGLWVTGHLVVLVSQ